MNTLLTGAFGFLGKQILSGLDLPVQTLGRTEGDIRCDLRTEVPSIDIVPDLVVHAAGKAHSIPRNKEEARDFFAVNLQGTINLTKALEAGRDLPQSFVFISTVAVYGCKSGEQIDEATPLKGSSPYALSKIEAERFIADWGSCNGVRVAILRLPLVAGPNPPGNLKLMINGMAKNRYLAIGNGQARKSIVLGTDVGAVILAAAREGGVFNLTDGYNPSLSELEKLISSQLNINPPRNIPFWMARALGKVGDILGSLAPINSAVVEQLTSTLTFSDAAARERLDWSPNPVLEYFKIFAED